MSALTISSFRMNADVMLPTGKETVLVAYSLPKSALFQVVDADPEMSVPIIVPFRISADVMSPVVSEADGGR